MAERTQSRADAYLLLSLVVVILSHPALDQGPMRRLMLAVLIFLPVIASGVRLSQERGWLWQTVVMMSATLIAGAAAAFTANRAAAEIKWGLLALFFLLAVTGLFAGVRSAREIDRGQLYTAASIYLLLAMLWFAIYCFLNVRYPGSFSTPKGTASGVETDLLYFSLVTLTTLGYGDVVALTGEARILAALEAVTGVLYVAITVAILVTNFRRHGRQD